MLYFCPNFILILSFSFVIPSSSDPYLAPENIGKSQLHFTQSGPLIWTGSYFGKLLLTRLQPKKKTKNKSIIINRNRFTLKLIKI